MNPQEENDIKAKAYKEFQKKYLANRDDGKTKAVQLSSEERLEFCREQRKYVEEKYEESIYKKYGEEKLSPSAKKHEKFINFLFFYFEIIKKFNFFELKVLPLKYEDGKIFQKGIDVRIAVDLVYHAFNDHFDVVVICTGDIDLIEAVRLVKSLGKKVIIASHPRLASKELRKEADFFINLSKINDEELNCFSRTK